MSYDEFRKRIDTARNILVGAVPSPAGQIDQITYALMYKFMNDLDDQSAALGGKRTYFVGDYAKYNWHELMSPTLGAHERLELYRQAVQTMAKNPGLPPLFQEIYANAFLPFNSPNVLNLFLKEIDTFSHGESDDIGDAYEYLLSITGAQGDVGQFRTPRHIIKFIVEAVNPTKSDSVLDPASGTAGFLNAAYNHVKRHHDGVDDISGLPTERERSLSSDELEKLHHNYHGFDIDPTMVRTASVNMYLHGFTTPDIRNHDTLSSEEYWDKRYDVILANPPFMTPKGGIQPHKKFSISANRAEVLFVDYIASHINPVSGRAGIVVPEGIIFQSGNAYRQLRKNLVENSLYAVVSLPAGVFNPYAGVKTSVLLLDKKLAKERDSILFVKIENDGFSLNAQRRPIAGDQFPEVLQLIQKHKDGEAIESPLAHAISRRNIADSGDYNLSGDRYKIIESASQDWPVVSLSAVCTVDWGNTSITKSSYIENGEFLAVSAAGMDGRIAHCEQEANTPVLSAIGANCGKMFLPKEKFTPIKNTMVFKCDKNKVLPEYLYNILSGTTLPRRGGAQPFISKGDMNDFKIPLPPIEIQREIVAEFDGYQKIIDAAQTIVKTYKPIIKINPEWEQVKLQDIADLIQRGKSPKYGESNIRVIKSGQARGFYEFDFSKQYYTVPNFPLDHRQLESGDLLINSTGVGTAGRVTLFNTKSNDRFVVDSHITILRLDESKALSDYTLYSLAGVYGFDGIEKLASGSGGQIELGLTTIRNMEIPLPPIEIQREIVAELKAEQQLIDANKKLINIYQTKIRTKLAEIWGE